MSIFELYLVFSTVFQFKIWYFLVLTEKTLNSLHQQNVTIKTPMDWQIIVAWHCLRDRHLIQPALPELNYTITRAINGMMRSIILLNRKLLILK